MLNSPFVQGLEGRLHLSIQPAVSAFDEVAEERAAVVVAAAPAARAKAPKITGTWNGRASSGFGKTKIVLRVLKQDAKGKWSGTVSLGAGYLTISGTVNAKRQVKFVFEGWDDTAFANGNGKASVGKHGRTMSGRFTMTKRGTTREGTFSAAKE